jgi:NADH-quinone oxidoreductase subunit F
LDLHLLDVEPSDEERSAVDGVLGPAESGWAGGQDRSAEDHRFARGGHAAREQRHLLLPTLHALQSRVGWISAGGLNYLCARLTVPPAEAFGVATFYAMFSTEPRPQSVLHVCDDLACRSAGAEELIAGIERALGPERSGELLRSPCLGMCERAPAVLMQSAGEVGGEVVVGDASLEALAPFVDGGPWAVTASGSEAAPQTRDASAREGLRLLRRVGRVNPASLEDYRAHGGYEALPRAVELRPEGVIGELKAAKLLGRGGAAFPTGVKWEAVAQQAVRPHYFVCNADESEPGTFKDRVVMENDPFSVIEALTIAGFATGSEKGFIYIRGEYPHATTTLERAIVSAYDAGLLGADVMGAGFAFDIELRRGAGAYICGEETALFNSIEGKRGEPRNKPPFPVTHGLFGKPTGINNVETLVNVLEVLRVGGSAYAEVGTADSTGTRLFCLSGRVQTPGVYEVECGTTLGGLLALAGGVRGGRELKAILLGGAAGGFVTPDDLDVPLSFEGARAAGVTLGSGVVMVFDETVDLVDIVLRIARFFRDESCGQCVPCRVGTVRQEEALHRLVSDRTVGSNEDELRLLGEIDRVMTDASICGLGQTAASAVRSAVKRLALFDGRGSGA